MSYRYCLVRTAFHGGGIVSRHRTLAAAEKAKARFAAGECKCGCAHVVPIGELGLLPTIETCTSPYQVAVAL